MTTSSVPDLGAQRLQISELTEKQRRAADDILQAIRSLADSEAEKRHNRESYVKDLEYRHPRYVFVIDGNRGSGKTTLLLTLHHLLGYAWTGERSDLRVESREELRQRGFLMPQGSQRPLLVLDVLNPNEMERSEDTMENIFAQINNYLRRREKDDGQDSSAGYGRLREALYKEVAPGWAFSHELGIETLSRDSLDYDDFVRQRTEQTTRSYTRQHKWRGFVEDLLNGCSRELMVVCIDDTDLAPKVTENILNSIRLYLSHPRIVVLLCVNWKYIQHTLEMQAVERVGEALRWLPDADREEARWHERQVVDEYLYKILPPDFHRTLTLDRGDLDVLYRHASEDKAGEWSEALVEQALRIADPADAAACHLFQARSGELLTPLPVREVGELMRRFLRHEESTAPALFEEQIESSPSFARLVHFREGRGFQRLGDILEREAIDLAWAPPPVTLKVGGKRFRRAEPQFAEPQFQVLEWLIDQELVKHGLTAGLKWLDRLLPRLGYPGIGQAADPLAVGVAAYRGESSFPRNCTYFRDLTQISDGLFDTVFQGLIEPLNEGWKDHLDSVGQRGRSRLPHSVQAALREPGNSMAILQEVVASFHAGILPEDSSPAFRLPALWLVHGIVEGGKPLGGDEVASRLAAWAAPVASSDEANARFAGFLSAGQRLLRERWYRIQNRRRCLVWALWIAMGKRLPSDISDQGILQEIVTFLAGADRQRDRVLLAWSVAPFVDPWLADGVAREDMEVFGRLGPLIEGAGKELAALRQEDPKDPKRRFIFLDFPEQIQEAIERELFAAAGKLHAFAEAPRNLLLDRTADPFTLGRFEQIAYILRISPQTAQRLAEPAG